MDDHEPSLFQQNEPGPASASCPGPPEAQPPAGPVVPEPAAPAFSRLATWLWTLVLLAGCGSLLFSAGAGRDQLLTQPERYLDRVVGRDLDAADYAPRLPRWQRWLNAESANPSDEIQDAIRMFREFEKKGLLARSDGAPKALAILVAEAGETNQLENELRRLPESRSNETFVRLMRLAYEGGRGPGFFKPASTTIQDLSPEWARDKLAWRLAMRKGDPKRAESALARLEARGRTVQTHLTAISLGDLVIVLTGLAILAAWAWRGRGGLELGDGQRASPWSLGRGYAVVVRGAVAGILVAVCLMVLAEKAPALAGFTSLLSAIPLLRLTRQHLLDGPDDSLAARFGLAVPRSCWLRLAGLSAVLMSLMLLGEIFLGTVVEHWRESPLSESVPEELLFEPWSNVLWSVLDSVVWAPLVEELAFRGLVYTTLRRSWTPLGQPWSPACFSRQSMAIP